MTMTLRMAATQQDVESACRLAYEIYVEGMNRFEGIADHQNRLLVDEYDHHSKFFLAEDGDRLVGVMRITCGDETSFTQKTREDYQFHLFNGILEERDICVVSKLVFHPDYRGGDLAYRLYEKSMEYAVAKNAELILARCELHLVSHYRVFAFHQFGELSFAPHGVATPTAAIPGDLEYARQIGTPLLDVFARRTRPSTVVADLRRVISQSHCRHEPWMNQQLKEMGRTIADRRLSLNITQPTHMERLLRGSHMIDCHAGMTVIKQDWKFQCLYVLLSGSLDTYEKGRYVNSQNTPGALIGKATFLSKGLSRNEVVSGSPGARLLVISERSAATFFNEFGRGAHRLLNKAALEMAGLLSKAPATITVGKDGEAAA